MVSYGFQPGARRRKRHKKRAAVAGGFEVDNREASNRVDRSHSVSKEDADSHTWESLIDRKRAIFFRLCLPYRPLADWPLSLGLEEIVRRVLGGALLRHCRLQPFGFGRQQRNALVEFFHREQREVLPDLVGDFLSRP